MPTDGLSLFRSVLLAVGLASCSSIASSAPARVATPAKPTAATPLPVHSDLVKPVQMAGGLSGGLDARSAALVFAKAQAGEGWQALCQRATGQRTRWKELAAVNADVAPRAGAWYRIPPGLWPSGTGQQLLLALSRRMLPRLKADGAMS